MDKIIAKYEQLWDDFTDDLFLFRALVKEELVEAQIENLHKSLRDIYHFPKSKIIKYQRRQLRGLEAPNPGSISGLFFEELITCFIDAKIPSNVKLYRNYMPDNEKANKIKKDFGIRDPDIYLTNDQNDRHYLLELKFVADDKIGNPFINKLETISDQSQIKYDLIVGWSSFTKDWLSKGSHEWLYILDAYPRHLEIIEDKGYHKFGTLLDNIVAHFNS